MGANVRKCILNWKHQTSKDKRAEITATRDLMVIRSQHTRIIDSDVNGNQDWDTRLYLGIVRHLFGRSTLIIMLVISLEDIH